MGSNYIFFENKKLNKQSHLFFIYMYACASNYSYNTTIKTLTISIY